MLFLIGVGQLKAQFNSNLPILEIRTPGGASIPQEPKINAYLRVIYNGPGQRNALTDSAREYSGKIGIEQRGQTSNFLSDKKPFSIELRDAAGEDKAVPLLGMPEESDWVLLAPFNDKTMMRDVLAYSLGAELGRWAPRWRYAEVVLNGRYEGVYVLLERIKRDKNRVNIKKLDPDDVSGDKLTGGYILRIDKSDDPFGEGWFSTYPANTANRQGILFLHFEPKNEDLAPEQRNYIRNYVQQFENRLASSNFKDPVNGYRKLTDVPSFIDFSMINEVTKNIDGYRISTYFYKDRDSENPKMQMGPLWDFNISSGNADYCIGGNERGWVWNFNQVCPDDGYMIPFWWERMRLDQEYMNAFGKRYMDLRTTVLQTDRIIARIDSIANLLSEAQVRNFQRFPILGQYIWPNYFVGKTYQEEVQWLKDWYRMRLNWMDQEIKKLISNTAPGGDEVYFKVHPNPANNLLIFECPVAQVPATISITSMTGQRVWQQTMRNEKETLELDGAFSPGVYVVKFENLRHSFQYKVVLSK